MGRNSHKKPGNGFWHGTCSKCGESITRRNSISIDAVNDKGQTIRIKGVIPRICKVHVNVPVVQGNVEVPAPVNA